MVAEIGPGKGDRKITESRNTYMEDILSKIARGPYADIKGLVMRGLGLEFIIGDDANALGPVIGIPFTKEFGLEAKDRLLGCMDWEIGYQYLPFEVKKRLRECRTLLEKMNWESESGFKEAKGLWEHLLKDWVEELCDKESDYRNAIKAFNSVEYKD